MNRRHARLSLRCDCCTPGTSRRGFLASAVAFGAAVATAPHVFAQAANPAQSLGQAATQGAAAAAKAIIDVHHHIAPPAYMAELNARAWSEPPLARWTVERSLEDMDKAGVQTAITSITTPGIWFGDDGAARRLARKCNDYGARLVADHPGRFGLFASPPLPDVDGSLREIEYAFDTLRADGVCLMTSYGDKWLGDPAFDPVMEELNRRKAVVYTHPTTANCCRNILPVVPRAMVEFGADTSRAIGSILFTGTATRYPDIKFIFSHGGGAMPFLYERYVRAPQLSPTAAAAVPRGVDAELKKFFYDTAQIAHRPALASLTEVVPASQILFGTDYPYRTSADHVKGVGAFGFAEADLRKIYRENALALVPRLKAA